MADGGIIEKLTVMLGVEVDKDSGTRATNWISALELGLVAVATAAAAAAGAVAGFVADATQAGDEALAAARKIGLTTEALTELRFAANAEGVNEGSLETGIRVLGRQIDEARQKAGPAREEFARMGITLDNLNGLTIDAIFERLSDALAATEDPARRTGSAMTLLGKGGADLIPLLTRGSDGIRELRETARDLGLTISTEAAVAADDFGDQMELLGLVVTGVERRIGFGLIPAVKKITDRMEGWWRRNRDWINLKVDQAIGALTFTIDALNGPLGVAVGLFSALVALRVGSNLLQMVAAMGPLGAGVAGLVGSLAPLIPFVAVVAGLALAFDDLSAATRGENSVAGELADFLGVGGPFNEAMVSLGDEMAAFGEVSDLVWADFAQGARDAYTSVMETLGPLGSLIDMVVGGVQTLTGGALTSLGGTFKDAAAGFRAYANVRAHTKGTANEAGTRALFNESLLSMLVGSELSGLTARSSTDGIIMRRSTDQVGADLSRNLLNGVLSGSPGQVYGQSSNVFNINGPMAGQSIDPDVLRQVEAAAERGQRKALDDAMGNLRGGQR